MDIYSYLKKDHRKVSDLLKKVLATENIRQREEILAKINDELLLHAETEQATFYAALLNKPEMRERIQEAEDEHKEMKGYLKKLSKTSAEDEMWLELFGEFKHAVEHHVREEEGQIFEKARKLLDENEARWLAERMDTLKREAVRKAA